MLFKSQHDYEPDAGCDDAPEAVAEAAPTSEARQRLRVLLAERSEAESAVQSARDAIGRLQGYINAPGPIEADLAALDSTEADQIAKWSTAGGPFPVLNADRRRALEESLGDARNKASGAQRAIPAVEAGFTAATNEAHKISLAVKA